MQVMETKILNLLKENSDSFLSGEEISRQLYVSRTAVWKHIQHLKDAGYEIIAQPHLGYRLQAVPDKMLPDEIGYNLNTKIFAKKIISFSSTTSTNDVAYKLAEQGQDEGALVVAEEQSRGRGRMERKWLSPPGVGIYASLILRPKITPIEAGKITLMGAVSIAKIIRKLYGITALIKWPNDVFIENEKICGILTEMNAEQDLIKFVILGMGVNVNNDAAQIPPGATSLKIQTGRQINRIEFFQNVLEELEAHYVKIIHREFDFIIDEWRNLSLTLGRRVKIKRESKNIEGQAMDIDENGALIIRDDFGFSHHILSGDVQIER